MKELIERLREGKKANAPYEADYAIPPTKLNREAADALERLTAENAALKADVERLDYLDSLATYNGSFMGGTHHLEFTHEFYAPNGSFRAAIDAAIAGENK